MMFERIVWLVPAAVAAFGIWRPRAGLVILAASLPFFGVPPGGPYLAALDVAAIAAILSSWRGGRADPSPLTWPAAAFVAVSLVSLVPSSYQPPSWQPSTLFSLLKALPGVETWSALYTWRAAADLLLGWGLFLAVRRAFSGRSPLPLAQAFLAGLTAVLMLGLASERGAIDLGGFRPHAVVDRLHSVFFLSGWLSEYIVLAAPLAIAALAATRGRLRFLALPLAALSLASLGLTLQRGAWLAALAQVVFLALALALRRRSGERKLSRAFQQASLALALTAAVLVASGGSMKPMLDRARSMGSGLAPRQLVWTAAADMTRQRPFFGWGLGSFAPAYDLTHPPGSENVSRFRNTAHSIYLDIAAERGLLGILALGLIGWTLAACLRRPRPDLEAMAFGLGASFVGAATYGLVQYLFHLKSIALLLWLLLGCVTLVSRHQGLGRSRRAAQGLVAVALLLVPIRALFIEPPHYAGNHTFGLHETEGGGSSGTYRWTKGSAAMRIPWNGEVLLLELANGHPLAAARPVDVVVGIDGRTVTQLRLTGPWETYPLNLGPPSEEEVLLTLEVRPTFRPFNDFREAGLEPSLDIRSLGVAMREPRWQ